MPYRKGLRLLHRVTVFLYIFIWMKNTSSLSDDYRTFNFSRNYNYPPDLSTFAVTLYICTDEVKPTWLLDKAGQQVSSFVEIGHITCENSELPVTRKIAPSGESYWIVKFNIGVAFGGLQIKARIESPDGSFKSIPVKFRANSLRG